MAFEEIKQALKTIPKRDLPFLLFGLVPWVLFFWKIEDLCSLLDKPHGLLVLLAIIGIFAFLTILCISIVILILVKIQHLEKENSSDIPSDTQYLERESIEKEMKNARDLGGK